MKQAFRNCFLCVTAIAALLSLTAATYAWFTSNQEVSTTRASARTAEESLELQISSDGSTFFQCLIGCHCSGQSNITYKSASSLNGRSVHICLCTVNSFR